MTYKVIPMESCPKSSIPHQLLSSKNETRSSKKKILCPRKTNIGSYSMYLGVENALSIDPDTTIRYIKLEPNISKVCSSTNLSFYW